MMLVKSQVKYIQSLGQKKFRDQEDVFVAEGTRIINELLCADNVMPVTLVALKSWVNESRELIDQHPGIKIIETDESWLERISSLKTPNQVIGVFRKPEFQKSSPQNKFSLALDAVQDPGNLGTIVRTADWFGIDLVVCGTGSADLYNSKVIQATMGSISRVQVLYTDLSEYFAAHQDVPVYAMTMKGKNIFTAGQLEKGIILVGNEARGINAELLSMAAMEITIPGGERTESLNAAMAAGIAMAELTAKQKFQ